MRIVCGLALAAALFAAPPPATAWDSAACTDAGSWLSRQSAPGVAETKNRFAPCAELLFSMVDTDGSGGLSPAEVEQVTTIAIHMIAESPQARGTPMLVRLSSLAPVLAHAIFRKIDYDRSGEITMAEVLDDRTIALALQAVRIVNTAQAAPNLQQALETAVPALFGLLR